MAPLHALADVGRLILAQHAAVGLPVHKGQSVSMLVGGVEPAPRLEERLASIGVLRTAEGADEDGDEEERREDNGGGPSERGQHHVHEEGDNEREAVPSPRARRIKGEETRDRRKTERARREAFDTDDDDKRTGGRARW